MADYKKMQENIKLICERVSMGERMAMLAEETGAGGGVFERVRRRSACGDERHPAAVAACGNWVQNGAEAGQMGNAAERRDGEWE